MEVPDGTAVSSPGFQSRARGGYIALLAALLSLLTILALAACTAVPPPSTPPEAEEELAEKADASRKQEEWFLRRLREADGTVRENAFASGPRSWEAWVAGHPPAAPPDKAASPLDARSWREAGPRNIAGRVLAVAFDPTDSSVIWAGSAGGGLWRSGDFGQTWRQMGGDHLPSLWIGAIAIDPNHPKVLYLGTGEANVTVYGYGGYGGLLKTADGGQTFTRIPLPEPAFYRILVSAADSSLVLTAARNGLYRSADAGGHFAKVLPGRITDLTQDPKNPSRFLAVCEAPTFSDTNAGLYESLDAGLTWHRLGTLGTGGLPSPFQWGRAAIAFAPAPSRILYLALAARTPEGPTLFRSLDDGATWTAQQYNSRQGYSGGEFLRRPSRRAVRVLPPPGERLLHPDLPRWRYQLAARRRELAPRHPRHRHSSAGPQPHGPRDRRRSRRLVGRRRHLPAGGPGLPHHPVLHLRDRISRLLLPLRRYPGQRHQHLPGSRRWRLGDAASHPDGGTSPGSASIPAVPRRSWP